MNDIAYKRGSWELRDDWFGGKLSVEWQLMHSKLLVVPEPPNSKSSDYAAWLREAHAIETYNSYLRMQYRWEVENDIL